MKKIFKRLCAAIIAVVMLSATAAISSASLNASAEEVFVPPDSVDNSQSPHFPEIGDQGNVGSCSSWANVYYGFTYAMNKSRGIKTTYDNTFSPQWSYSLTSNGEDGGSGRVDIVKLLERQGGVPLPMAPYKEVEFEKWCPDYDVWRESINNRLAEVITYKDIGRDNSQITSVDDDDLTEIKTALAKGEILTFSTHIKSRVTTNLKSNLDAPGNEEFLGEVAVKYLDGDEGPHAMTIVGYNDNIWVDINENNEVDSGEMGAFKIANSWDSNWANKGFIWFAYDAANMKSSVAGFEDPEKRVPIIKNAGSFVPRPYGDGTDVYIRYYFKTGDRRKSHIIITADKDGNEYTYKAFFPLLTLPFGDAKIPYEGNMVVALDNVIPDISADNFSDYNWRVTFVDKNNDECSTTYDNAEIVIESTGEIIKPQNAYPFNLNGEEKTIEFAETSLNHATVYYRGYANPQINYNVKGQWVNSFMESNTEREGYVYKFVVDLEDKDSAQIFFTDEKGNKDDNLGKNFIVTKGLNYFVTEGVAEPLEISLSGDADIYECSMVHHFTTDVKGGYGPYSCKCVFENLDTGEKEETVTYKNNGNNVFIKSFKKAGNYRVTSVVTDIVGMVTEKSIEIEVIDSPFEFSEFNIVNDGELYPGKPIEFHAVTKYENINPVDTFHPQYDLVIKKDGEIYCEEVIDPVKVNRGAMTSIIDFSWTPTEAGHYIAKISDTDNGKDYAEKTIEFDVVNKTGVLKIDVTGGSGFYIKAGDGPARPQGITYYNSKLPVGKFITVTAVATSGAEFIGWTNPANGQIVSTDLTFSFYASGNDRYQAIFATDIIGVNMVMFYNDKSHQCWDMQYYAAGDEIYYPDALPHYGYGFTGWDHTDNEIQAKLTAGEDVMVLATWERVIAYIDVNAVGGTIVTQPEANGQHIAGRAVEVTANKAESGKKFAYWVDEKGVVRSFETTYKFYPTVDTTMTAIFVAENEAVEYQVLVSIDNFEPVENDNGSFIFSWYVPEAQKGITYVDSGIVAVNKDNYNEDTLVHGTQAEGIVLDRIIIGKYAIPSNSASWIGPVKSGQTWVARAWVQYTDANGVLHTEYSDLFEVTKD